MTSSESDERLPSRKRSRPVNNGEDSGATGGKRARGRPRVDTQDATAADRRRTQIRLAQRAYRQRKESTISSLKAQSAQLQSVIEQMNRGFTRLNDSIQNSGLLRFNPSLEQEFKLVNESFQSLAKSVSEGQYDGEDDAGEAVEPSTDRNNVTGQQSQLTSPIEVESQQGGWSYPALNAAQKTDTVPPPHTADNNLFHRGTYGQPGTTNSLAQRRQFTVGDVLDQSRFSQKASDQAPTLLPFGILDLLSSQPFSPPSPQIYSVTIPTPELTPPLGRLSTPPLSLPNPLSLKTLAPLATRSLDESTFTRRLSRAAAENGFHLLSAASVRPAAINYVFKFSLPYHTTDQLLARFKILLSRGPHEEVDWPDTPFIHLGGAGTHYPRRDNLGHVIPIKNSWIVRSMESLDRKAARLESVADGRWKDLDGVDLAGYEGKWFDAHDVESYFAEQFTCQLDARSPFAECVIEEEENGEIATSPSILLPQDFLGRRTSETNGRSPSLSRSSVSTSSSSSASMTPTIDAFTLSEAPFGLDMAFPQTQNPYYPTQDPKLANYDISFDQTLGMDLAPGFGYGLAGGNGWGGDVDLGLSSVNEDVEPLPVVRQKKKRKAWVDVNKLVDELNKRSICLGRAPGFRKSDVDRAFQMALVSPQ